MKNRLKHSHVFRDEQLNSLNQAVLNIIHHKKYPLNYHLVNSPRHIVHHYHLRKLSTTPSQPFNKPPTPKPKHGLTGRQWPGARKKESIGQSSMGAHLQTMCEKPLELPSTSGECYDEVSKKINSYLWQKKKNRRIHTLQENSLYRAQQQKSQNDHTLHSLSKLLKTLRKSLLQQLLNQPEPDFDPPTTLTIKQPSPELKSIDFYQDSRQRSKLSKKYPIKMGRVQQDLNKQLILDMGHYLKQGQDCDAEDKYNRMRIVANHKKIISLG